MQDAATRAHANGASAGAGMRIDVVEVSRSLKDGRRLLSDVSFCVRPGELVAIVGGSGAGKTTLLNALAGLEPPTSGRVLFDERDYYENIDEFRTALGYVPQDDIIHRDLPLALTLRYSAQLRLPPDTPGEEKEEAVRWTLDVLGLSERARVPVRALSGGQRKRASIGVELLTRPRVFFLDEPTSGLDAATSREFMRLLRRLADQGSTVVMTTHNVQDVPLCDKVVFLAGSGHLAFCGPPTRALVYFGASSVDEVYERLNRDDSPAGWQQRFRASEDYRALTEGREPPARDGARSDGAAPAAPRRRIGAVRQWYLLTRRSFDILWRSPLTLAILVGSPLMVILMFAVLFRPGAFEPDTVSPSAAVMILFWIAFGAFFFGLTYGLLQVCTEFPVYFRERLVNLRVLPYVASKVAVLLPVLVMICVLMLVVLRLFDRLPPLGAGVYLEMSVTLVLSAAAALALGLLTSAAVSNPEQATIAMPMLCFPAVLFSGAILPVPVMAFVGQAMSVAIANRYTFEALGNSLDVNRLLASGASPLGPPLLEQYGSTFERSPVEAWLVLAGFTALFHAATCLVLTRKKAHR